ncbi:SLAM family member 5-like [Hyla sarda]|uniref:SLAM family member 5-like n=1 Tax=Hyla sarda TaxID=327740 RepID=UPI0024C2A3FB|nr:SLAM family member 5-like [Hyla sarda]XP_056401430.1 SLAM family member 5-like [Hyla sarda]XP_056401431.1 SLAM family member 5-like [Hyla sarda]XP_056401432.1 SLAM family member 5-like [Hyla sarda]
MVEGTMTGSFWIFIILLLHETYIGCADLCGETIVVNGMAGGNGTLQMSVKYIEDVTWIRSNNRIATTWPHNPIIVMSPYMGKLASDQDGSLIILNLHQEDEGTYDASIKLQTGDMCTQQYQIHVYQRLSDEDIKIRHNVFSQAPCRMTLACAANGTDVTITWTSNDTRVTNRAVNVTDPDPKTQYTCTAENPVSNASKSITASEYCGKGTRGNISSIVATVCVVIFITIVVCGLFYKYRRRTSPPAGNPQ